MRSKAQVQFCQSSCQIVHMSHFLRIIRWHVTPFSCCSPGKSLLLAIQFDVIPLIHHLWQYIWITYYLGALHVSHDIPSRIVNPNIIYWYSIFNWVAILSWSTRYWNSTQLSLVALFYKLHRGLKKYFNAWGYNRFFCFSSKFISNYHIWLVRLIFMCKNKKKAWYVKGIGFIYMNKVKPRR